MSGEQGIMRRLGVHTSIAGGIPLSLERAKSLGCTTMQIFSHNPRQWDIAPIPDHVASEFKTLRVKNDISPVFIHTSYLINLAAESDTTWHRSIYLLYEELELADSLGVEYVVLHTGSASADSERGRIKALRALQEISKKKQWRTKLLLENTAGEKGDLTSRMSDLANLVHQTGSTLIGGVCIDTCHAFAAGYNIADQSGVSELAREIEEELGIDQVKLIHLNDSKRPLNSHVDRHEHIGEGAIGAVGLKRCITHPAFSNVPLILETPKKSEEDDPRNLSIVRAMINDRVKHQGSERKGPRVKT